MNTLAEKLADAWIKRDLIKLNSNELPKSREDSHNIQKQFHAALKKKTVGWKIGLVSKNLQEGAKVNGPMIGKIIDETVLINPITVQYSKVPDCILECEFCLKFTEDTKMVSGAENKKGNYEAYVALELVSTRVHAESKKDLDPIPMMNLNIADNGGAGAIVVGDKIQNLDKIDLDSIQVEIDLNGKKSEPYFKGEKRAGPIEAIKCIIDEFKDNPITFKKGDWFMTGSVIQPFKVSKGDKLKVDFRTLGKINVDFI